MIEDADGQGISSWLHAMWLERERFGCINIYSCIRVFNTSAALLHYVQSQIGYSLMSVNVSSKD